MDLCAHGSGRLRTGDTLLTQGARGFDSFALCQGSIQKACGFSLFL